MLRLNWFQEVTRKHIFHREIQRPFYRQHVFLQKSHISNLELTFQGIGGAYMYAGFMLL